MDPVSMAVIAWFLMSGERKDREGPPTRRRRARPSTRLDRIEKLEKDLPITRSKPPPPPPYRGRRRRPSTKTKTTPTTKTTTTTTTTRGRTGRPLKTTTTKTTTRRSKSPLMRRANQQRARDWAPDLEKAGASPRLAKALARWIGMESSGKPLVLSRIGERGLLQATKTTALKEKLFTPAEWEKLRSPASSRAFHAKMAMKQYKFHRRRARRWVNNKPPLSSLDWVYYAKMHHTRPRDLQEGKVHGPALPMARDLWTRGKGQPRRRQRLALANVSRFGKVYV